MDTSNELIRAKETLIAQLESDYKSEVNGINTITVSEGKDLTISGGQEKLQDLRDGYDSLFVDPDVPETEGAVKQADGSLVMCTQVEWDELLRQMRIQGRVLFDPGPR